MVTTQGNTHSELYIHPEIYIHSETRLIQFKLLKHYCTRNPPKNKTQTPLKTLFSLYKKRKERYHSEVMHPKHNCLKHNIFLL